MAEALAARRYAEALIRLAKDEGERLKFEEDISFIIGTLNLDARFTKILTHPRIKKSDKVELINKLWKPHVTKTVFNFMLLLIEKRRIYEINMILKQYDIEMKRLKGIYLANVQTAYPLDEKESGFLKAQLEKISGLKLEIKNKVRPEIIGGALVRIGDDVIDWRVSRMLNSLNESMRRDELIGIMDGAPEESRVINVEKE